MTDTATSPLFDEVVAAWDELLRCQTDQTQPCTKPAAWLAVLHQPCARKPPCATTTSTDGSLTGSPTREVSCVRGAGGASTTLTCSLDSSGCKYDNDKTRVPTVRA